MSAPTERDMDELRLKLAEERVNGTFQEHRAVRAETGYDAAVKKLQEVALRNQEAIRERDAISARLAAPPPAPGPPAADGPAAPPAPAADPSSPPPG